MSQIRDCVHATNNRSSSYALEIGQRYVTNNGREKATKTGRERCPEKWTRFYIQKAAVP